MRVIRANAVVVICVLSLLGLSNCVASSGSDDEPGGSTSPTDVSAADSAPVEDVATVPDSMPTDTAIADVPSTEEDAAVVEDTAPAADIAPVEDTSPAEDTALPPVDAGAPTPDGLCTSPDDQAIVDSQNDDFDIEQISKDCVIANILGDPDGAKAKKCIQDATDLSDGCTECFGEVALCGKDKCLGSCALNPEGQGCTDCIAENCLPAFEECSGLSTAKE